ncbi:bifunctional non-homologous end joining protein LigD [Prauserella sediminis]|uniref:DNA ligase (ATP) n=1 Tax=Prauserella sediminis TaxID=577680 RepID=A0A839XHC6_9PSEU|nr:non-homologous end-joining DNA ligase [Prauserella sediminis]MBB3663372.1 bifunctional non-homologous end joining protein LigD [Prauserella sediminis]
MTADDDDPVGHEPLPPVLLPMLATPGTLPEGEGWSYEFKWDGVRALVRADGDEFAVFSRRGGDITDTYPELAGLASQLTTPVWLDGEIVALSGGVPSFAALQKRMHAGRDRVAQLAVRTPVTYVVFDVLHHDGRGLLASPYAERRELLESLGLAGSHWTVSPCFDDGAAVADTAARQGLEGVVAKRSCSPYRPGRRSEDWVKVTENTTLEAVIGGWRTGEGRRADTFGSLLLGLPREDPGDADSGPDDPAHPLRYIGQVGTGFTDDVLEELSARLRELETADRPFAADEVPRERARGAHWVRPVLVGEVEFKAWTDDGRLRAPSWRGLRPDRTPEELSQ